MQSVKLNQPPKSLWQRASARRVKADQKILEDFVELWCGPEKSHPAPIARDRVFTSELKQATAEVLASGAPRLAIGAAAPPTARPPTPAPSADEGASPMPLDSRRELMELIAQDSENDLLSDIPAAAAPAAAGPGNAATAVAGQSRAGGAPPSFGYQLDNSDEEIRSLDTIYFHDGGEMELERMIDGIGRRHQADAVALLLYDPAARAYRVLSSKHWDAQSVDRFVISPGDEYVSAGAIEQSLRLGDSRLVDQTFRKRFSDEFWRSFVELRLYNLLDLEGDGFLALAFRRARPPSSGWSAPTRAALAALLPAAERIARARWRRPESVIQDRSLLERIVAAFHRFTVVNGGRMITLHATVPALLDRAGWRSVQQEVLREGRALLENTERLIFLAPHRWIYVIRPARLGPVTRAAELLAGRLGLDIRLEPLHYPEGGQNLYNYVLPDDPVGA